MKISSLRKNDIISYLWMSILGYSSVGYAYFSQEFLGFEPCPLCLLGRLFILTISSLLIVYAWRPWRELTWILGALLLGGAGISLYHVWIQVYPPQSLSCGPGLSFWIETLTLPDIIHNLFSGHGECTDSSWKIFGIPGSALPLFYYMAVTITIIIRHSIRVVPPWIHPDDRKNI